MLRGFIINKFRGDPTLFESGVTIIERRTRRPVLGVVPYAGDLVLPEEDSVALGRKRPAGAWEEAGGLRIGVVRLPHISNYTDFDPLEQEPGVNLRYLDHRDELAGLDLLILPGTKNTISDLLYLKETGLFAADSGLRPGRRPPGGHLRRLPDPGAGSPGPPGGGRRPPDGTRARVSCRWSPPWPGPRPPPRWRPGCRTREDCGVLSAYEIHMGVTEAQGEGQPAFEIVSRNGRPLKVADGWVAPDRRVWGTYLHGLFDNDGFRRVFLQELQSDPAGPGRHRPGDVL